MGDFISTSFEAEMNQAEIQAMIDASINTNDFKYHFPFDVNPNIARNNPASSFSLATLVAPAVQVLQAAGGANKIVELAPIKFGQDEPFEIRAAGWRRKWGCFVGHYTSIGASATQYAGIELGSFDSNAPLPSISTSAVAQLRIRMSDQKFEFVTAKGDGTSVVTDVIDIGAVLPHGTYMELEHDYTNGFVKAYIDGVLVGTRLSSSAAYPDFGAHPALAIICGLFATTGSDVTGSWDQTLFFSNANYHIYWR